MIPFGVSHENRKILFAIFFIALIVRAGSVAFFHPPLTSDDKDYDAIARSLSHGDGFALDGKPTAFRPPGYPFLLASTYAVFGDSKTPMRIFQGIADVLSCFLLFSIGKKMFSEKAGLAAAAILALFPIQILYVSHLMTETIFTAVLLLIVWLVVHEKNEHPSLRESLMLGVLTGIGVLIRPTAALLPLAIALYRWKNGTPFPVNMRSLAVAAAAAQRHSAGHLRPTQQRLPRHSQRQQRLQRGHGYDLVTGRGGVPVADDRAGVGHGLGITQNRVGDTNNDGVLDNNETGLAGWTVFDDLNGNGVLDPPAVTTTAASIPSPLAIPDGSGSLVSTLTVGGLAGSIMDLNVNLTINRTPRLEPGGHADQPLRR